MMWPVAEQAQAGLWGVTYICRSAAIIVEEAVVAEME